MRAYKVDLPNGAADLVGAALHVEAWKLGDCTVLIAREDFADAREKERDFRWQLTIAHPLRKPTLEEIFEARKLLPEGVHFALPFPHRAYWLEKPGGAMALVEIKDPNLTEQLEFDAIERRNAGASEIWVDDPPAGGVA